MPPYTRGRVSLSRGPGRKPGASLYTRQCLSLTGGRVKAWCLRIQAAMSLSHGGQGESLVPPYTSDCVSLAHGGQGGSLVPPYTRGSVSLSMMDSARHVIGCNLTKGSTVKHVLDRGAEWCRVTRYDLVILSPR